MPERSRWLNTFLYSTITIVSGIIVFSVVFLLSTTQSTANQQPVFDSSLAGRNLASEEFYDLNGKLLNNDDLAHGDVILISIHSGCHACKIQIQALPQIRKTIPDNVKIYLVGFEKAEDLSDFSKTNAIAEPVIRADGNYFKDLKVNYFPTTFYLHDGLIKSGTIGKISGEQINTWIKANQ